MKKIVSFLLAMVIMLGSVPINAFAGDVTVAPDVTVQEQNTTPAEGEKTLTEGTQPKTEGTQPQTEGAQPLTEGAQPLTDPNADPAALAATTATKILIPINETATVSYRNGVSYQLEPSGIVTLEPIQNGKSLKIRPIERGSAVLTVTTKTKTLTYNIEVAPITTGFFVVTPTDKSLGAATPEITTNVPYTKVGVGNLNIWNDGIKHVGSHYGLIDYNDKFINNNYFEEPETIQGTFEYKGKTYNYADCTISWYKIVDEGKDGNIEIHVDGYITALPTVVNPPVVTGKEVDVNVWYWNNADEANSLVAANTPPVPKVTTGEALKYQYGEDILNNNNLDLLIAACEDDFYAKKNVKGLTYIRTEIVEIIGEGANSQVVILYTTDSNDTECEHLYNSIGETVIKDVENLQRVEIRVVFNDEKICNVKFEQPKYIADEDKDTTAAINALTENFVATNGKIAEGTKLLKILPTFETIDGYTFDGWGIKDADGNETKMTDDTMPAGGITLVPYFTKNVVIEPKDIKVYYFIYQNPSSTMNDFTPVKQVNKNEKLIYEYNGETLTDSRLEQLAADYLAKLAETNDVEGISYLYADIYQIGADNIYKPVHTNENLNRGRTVYTTRTTGVQNNNNDLSDLSEVKVTAETEIRLMFSGTVKNKEYAVTFKTLDENNETVNNVTNMPTIEKIIEDAKIEELLSTPKADGYEFKGWFIGTKKVNSTTVMPNKDIELTAKFAKKPQAQVSFKAVDENGKELPATNMPTTENVVIGEPIGVPAETPTLDGYEFKGWFIGTEKVNSSTVMPNKDVEMIAKFQTKSYDITTIHNAPSDVTVDGMPEKAITVKFGETILNKLPTPTATVSGEKVLDFNGWFMENEKGELVKITANTVMPIGNIDVVAVFELMKKTTVNHIYNDRKTGNVSETLIGSIKFGEDFAISTSNQKYADVNYILTSTKVTVNGKDVTYNDGKVKVMGDIEVTYTYDVDMIDSNNDDDIIGDGIADKYQVVFTYETSDASQGSITGTLKEVINKQVTDKDGKVSYDETLKVKPVANIGINAESKFNFDYFASNVGSFGSISKIQSTEFSDDATFTAKWFTKFVEEPGKRPDRPDTDDDKPNPPKTDDENPTIIPEKVPTGSAPTEEIITNKPTNPVVVTPIVAPVVSGTTTDESDKTDTTDKSDTTEKKDTTEKSDTTEKADGTEKTTVVDEEVALAAKPTTGWALINLILTLVTIIATISIVVPLFRKKQDDEKKEDSDDEAKEYKKRTKMRLLSFIPSIISIIAFVLTENIFAPMFFVDKWTILMAVIALVQLVIYLFVRKDNDEKEQEEETAR